MCLRIFKNYNDFIIMKISKKKIECFMNVLKVIIKYS